LLCVGSLDIGIGETCQTTLTSRDLLTGTNLHCLADYRLAITYNSTVITNNIITSDYIGKTLRAQVTDLQTNNGCVTTLNIRDLSPPRIAAPADTEVSCAQTNATGSTPPSVTGEPRVIAECSTTTMSYNDQTFDAPSCNGTFTAPPSGFPIPARFDATKGVNASRIVLRKFTVRDFSNNISEAQQIIYIRKTDLTTVFCPLNYTVLCSINGFNTTPDSILSNGVWLRGTGKPIYANGAAISNGGCRIATSFNDVRTNVTTGYIIKRTWVISNTCTGEMRMCDQFITVNDQAPVLTCKTNYSATLAPVTGVARVPAMNIVNTLTDDCSPLSNLMVRIQRITGGMPWPDSVEVTFNCNDISTLPVEVIVKDGGGFMSKCQTTVQITDPNTVCRAPTQPAIYGKIETEEFKAVTSNVLLKSAVTPTISQFTRSSNYSFLGMPRGDDCDLTPSRDSDLINGVTTFDLALMSRHILDVQPINAPLKQIAGDVNADGSIDALDMVITRRLILPKSISISVHCCDGSCREFSRIYRFCESNRYS
jgi:Dockerin type I domain